MEEQLKRFVKTGTEGEPVEVPAEDFLEAIANGLDIDINHAVIRGNLDIGKSLVFTWCQQDESQNPILESYIWVRNSRFEGDVSFRYAIFEEPIFFNHTVFCRRACFGSTVFKVGGGFKAAIFNGELDFRGSTFKDNAEFGEEDGDNAVFNSDADFAATIFDMNADFGSVRFGGYTSFTQATFGGEAFFRSAVFSMDVDFSEAIFRRKAYFDKAIFRDVKANFLDADMEHPASFYGVFFQENTTLSGLCNYGVAPICKGLARLIDGVMRPLWRIFHGDKAKRNTGTLPILAGVHMAT